MINLQQMIIESKFYKTIEVDDLLFVQYECLVKQDAAQIWANNNYLAYVLGGKKSWKTHHNTYTVTSGEALFIKKGAHSVYQYFQEPFYVLFIFLPDKFIYNTLRKYSRIIQVHPSQPDNTESILRVNTNPVYESFFQSLLSYFLQSEPPQKELLKLKMEELVLNVFTQPGNEKLKHYFFSLGQRQQVDIKEIMETYFLYPLSIEEYSKLCARSLSAFRRDFKIIFNKTPGKWLIGKRLTHSRFLLETSDRTINDIIQECGFKNRSHFIKVFKDTYGYTPKQYKFKRQLSET
jgi:AraC-like DNA-binding protein